MFTKKIYSILFFLLGVFKVYSQDCGLIIPLYPLTSHGLIHPYVLTALEYNNECDVNTVNIRATILDLDTGKLTIFYPTVIDSKDTNNKIVINSKPTLPDNHVISLWFYTTGDTIHLLNPSHYIDTLRLNNCINAKPNILHRQFAYCNAIDFFIKVSTLINDNKIFISSMYKDNTHCKTALCKYEQELKHINQYTYERHHHDFYNTYEEEPYNHIDIILIIGNFIIDLWDRLFVRY